MIPNCLTFVGSDALPHGSVTWSRAALGFAFVELCLLGGFLASVTLAGIHGIGQLVAGGWAMGLPVGGEFYANRNLDGTVERCDE